MNIKKTKKIIIFVLAILLATTIKCYAETVGSFTISAGKTSLNVGDSTTLTINAVNCEGKFSITSSDASVVSASSSSEWAPGNAITLSAKKAGTATVTVSAVTVGDNQEEPEDVTGSKSITITVKEPASNNNNANENDNNTNENNNNNQNTNNTGNNNSDKNNTNNNNNNTETPVKKDEPTFQSTNETVYVTQTVNVRDMYSTSGNKIATLNAGDSVTRVGIGSNGWDKVILNGKTAYMIHSALSTEEPKKEEKSTNKSLKELIVENYQLTPEFDAKTTKYSLTLNNTDEELKITATPEDEKATVNITDNGNFKVGNNIVKITVTAEDGTTRMYTITVSKTNEDGIVDSLKLSQLEIANATLEPAFDPEITNYIIFAEDPSTIKTEDIVAKSDDKDVTVTTAENERAEDGEKVITIMLESKNGNKTGIYQITVKKPVVNQPIDVTNSTDNTIYYILGAIIAVLIFLIILIIIALKLTGNKGNNEEEEDELSDDYSLKGNYDYDDNHNEYDNMVQQSSLQSQILDTDINVNEDEDSATDESNESNNSDYSNDSYDEDYKPNLKSNKKGKHF